MIRILVVDDSSSVRLGMRFILESDSELKVVGEARNGEESIILSKKLRPDIITMDIMMPGMGGYEAIRQIMSEAPCPIIVVTGIDSPHMIEVSFKALEVGALTALQKPKLLDPKSEESKHLISQVKAMSSVKVVRRNLLLQKESLISVNGIAAPAGPVREQSLLRIHTSARLLAIGASTGGPPALQTILSGLPATFPLPIVVVQHISRGFVCGLVNWLSSVTPLRCKVGEQSEMIRAGTVYFAPEDNHMTVKAKGMLWLDPSDPMGGHRPSVTVLFESIAKNFGNEAIGILLTGMGKDGAQGLKAMRDAGAYTIAQDEASSVIYGMPAAAVELNAADEILNLDLIAPRLTGLATKVL
jgi:two-component system chemotaxis response regulator CheB